jgi:glycosyltransferase involved in cell wall biosynthesis
VLPSLHGGGAERAALRMLGELPRDRYEPTLYLFAREGPYLNEVGADVRLVSPDRSAGRAGRFLALRRFLAAERFDAVVSFLSYFIVYAACRTASRNTKYVISQQTPVSAFLQDADYHWRRPTDRKLFEAVARAIYPRADLIAASSQGVADDLVSNFGVRRDRAVVVHNPVDGVEVERQSREALDPAFEPDGRPIVMTAGRLADAKNLPLLVAALAQLAERRPFRAWILGQGELEPQLRGWLAERNLQDRVQLLGFQANPWKYMARADVFVLTSRYEGFGNVLIEAMASGVPVVAAASSGTREIIQHERNGLLVERHEPADVAAAIERVLTEPELKARLVDAGRLRAQEFSVSAAGATFVAALERMWA